MKIQKHNKRSARTIAAGKAELTAVRFTGNGGPAIAEIDLVDAEQERTHRVTMTMRELAEVFAHAPIALSPAMADELCRWIDTTRQMAGMSLAPQTGAFDALQDKASAEPVNEETMSRTRTDFEERLAESAEESESDEAPDDTASKPGEDDIPL